MNKQTKYFYLLKYIFLGIAVNLILGFIDRFLASLNNSYRSVIVPLSDAIGIVKVLLVIIVIVGVLYLLYAIIMYYNSIFYRDYRVEVFEAIYHGFADIHVVYDRIKGHSFVKDVQVDFKKTTITFSSKDENYCIKYLDLLGKIEGKVDSEFWASVSKPRTRYNQKTYMKRVKFPNPYRANTEFVRNLKIKTNKDYFNYVVISGFYHMKDKSEFIISPYEVIDLL